MKDIFQKLRELRADSRLLSRQARNLNDWIAGLRPGALGLVTSLFLLLVMLLMILVFYRLGRDDQLDYARAEAMRMATILARNLESLSTDSDEIRLLCDDYLNDWLHAADVVSAARLIYTNSRGEFAIHYSTAGHLEEPVHWLEGSTHTLLRSGDSFTAFVPEPGRAGFGLAGFEPLRTRIGQPLYASVQIEADELAERRQSLRNKALAALTLACLASVATGYGVSRVRYSGQRAEANRREYEARLRANELKLRALTDAADDALIGLTTTGDVRFWNHAAERIFGIPWNHADGRRLADLILREEVAPSFDKALQRVVRAQAEDRIRHESLELLALGPDKAPFFTEVTLAPAGQPGDVIRVVAVARDITHRKRTEQDLQDALRQSEATQRKLENTNTRLEEAIDEARRMARAAGEASRAKSSFLAHLSHEIRTPLNAIMGYAELLVRTANALDNKQSEQLQNISRSSEHLLTIINDILDISKIEAGKMELHNEPIHLPNMLKGIDGMFRGRALEKKIGYLSRTWSFEEDKPGSRLPRYVTGDEKRLRQILINLLGNAIKFTETGQVDLRIGRLAGKPDQLRFEVIDTGHGIAHEEQSRIFEAFHQAHAIREGGTGLGLTISSKLVQMLGGELEFESKPGEGSRFWFDIALPAVEGSPEDEPASQPLPVGYKGRKRYLLIVDDTDADRQLLAAQLEAFKLGVVEASSIEQAESLASGRPAPVLLMLDLDFERDNLGQASLLAVKEELQLRELPLVAISSDIREEVRSSCLEAGCAAFLGKPIRAEELAAAVGEVLGLKWIHEQRDVSPEQEKTANAHKKPPKADVKAMLEAARIGDLALVRDRAAILDLEPVYQPFCRRVTRHVRAFESAKLIAFLEDCLKTKGARKK